MEPGLCNLFGLVILNWASTWGPIHSQCSKAHWSSSPLQGVSHSVNNWGRYWLSSLNCLFWGTGCLWVCGAPRRGLGKQWNHLIKFLVLELCDSKWSKMRQKKGNQYKHLCAYSRFLHGNHSWSFYPPLSQTPARQRRLYPVNHSLSDSPMITIDTQMMEVNKTHYWQSAWVIAGH